MENDEFDDGMDNKELVLEISKFPMTPLLYMTEDIQRGIEFCRKPAKINGMAIVWDVYDVFDKEIILDAIKHPSGFRFFNCRWRNHDEIASRAIQLYPENNLYTNY